MTTQQYPKALMANIEAAQLGAVNHYAVADEVLAIAKFDVGQAARRGEHLVTDTRAGVVAIRRATARGMFTITIQGINAREIFAGTKADTVLYMSGLYKLEGGN